MTFQYYLVVIFCFCRVGRRKNYSSRIVRFICKGINRLTSSYQLSWGESSNTQVLIWTIFSLPQQAGLMAMLVGPHHLKAKHMSYPLPVGLTLETFDSFHELIVLDELSRCGSGGVLWALQEGLSMFVFARTHLYMIIYWNIFLFLSQASVYPLCCFTVMLNCKVRNYHLLFNKSFFYFEFSSVNYEKQTRLLNHAWLETKSYVLPLQNQQQVFFTHFLRSG